MYNEGGNPVQNVYQNGKKSRRVPAPQNNQFQPQVQQFQQFDYQGQVNQNSFVPQPQFSTSQFQGFQEEYQQQQPQQQPQHQQQQQYSQPLQSSVPQPNFPGNDYLRNFQSSAAGQIGMQLGTQALNDAQERISSNVNQYFHIQQWRFYFNVSNSYVFNKIRLMMFPFLQKSWSRIYDQNGNTTESGFAAPRYDLNSPDLYIPVMSFVTYVIMVGFFDGLEKGAR
jgi:hypothetical protein